MTEPPEKRVMPILFADIVPLVAAETFGVMFEKHEKNGTLSLSWGMEDAPEWVPYILPARQKRDELIYNIVLENLGHDISQSYSLPSEFTIFVNNSEHSLMNMLMGDKSMTWYSKVMRTNPRYNKRMKWTW